jgi:hypothetical protein
MAYTWPTAANQSRRRGGIHSTQHHSRDKRPCVLLHTTLAARTPRDDRYVGQQSRRMAKSIVGACRGHAGSPVCPLIVSEVVVKVERGQRKRASGAQRRREGGHSMKMHRRAQHQEVAAGRPQKRPATDGAPVSWQHPRVIIFGVWAGGCCSGSHTRC